MCFSAGLSVQVNAQRPAGQPVTGVVVDATGAVLPNAQVSLTPVTGAAQTTTTDATGTFRFEGVLPGRYDVRITFEGFQPTTVRVTVGSRTPSALRVVLPLAAVTQEITVSNQGPEVAANAATNADAVTVDQSLLESLPVFDQDLISTVVALSRRRRPRQRRRDGRRQRHGGQRAARQRLGGAADQDQSGSVFSRIRAAGSRPDRDSDKARLGRVSRRGESDLP